MTVSPRIYITDTNIWIDLHAGRLVTYTFRLPFLFAAPDVVIAELEEPEGQAIVELGLQVQELSGQEVSHVGELSFRYAAPSRVDLFALVLAKTRDGVLLTGDRELRKAAEQEKVPVHGTLWLIDQLINRRILAFPHATMALERMIVEGRRLPRAECERRLKRWKG